MKSYLYEKIADQIREKITSGEYKLGDKLPSETEIAIQYDVSVITSKKALDSLVKEGMLERTRGKGTFVTNKESNLENKKNEKLIGIVFDGYSESFGDLLMFEVEKEMMDHNLSFITRNSLHSEQNEIKILEEMINFNVDAIIIIPVNGEKYNPKLLKLILDDFPIIVVDRKYAKFESYYVGSDHFCAANQLANYILDKNDTICYIKSEINHDSLIERYKGIEQAFIDNNKPLSNLCTVNVPRFNDDSDINEINSTIEYLTNYFNYNPSSRMIIASDYQLALIIQEAFKAMKLNPITDYKIACFDSKYDILGQYYFTHMKQDQKKIAENTVNLLSKILDGEKTKKQILVSSTLLIGQSC